MSAVDSPPGLAFAGRAASEFAARAASVALARRSLWWVLIASGVSVAIMVRRPFPLGGGEYLLISPLVAVAIALVCYLVRRARLRIDGAGVRWGWDSIGFRVTRDELAGATIYDDAIGFRRRRGGFWYLSRHDFADFDGIASALRTAGIGFDRIGRGAPLRARLQTYGAALDLLVVLDALFASVALFLTLGG